MAPPLELIGDVVFEIFLRLPPDEPEHLVRASLVCKPWLRIATDRDFLRRYRAFHRTPPLLGYLQRRQYFEDDPELPVIATTAVPLAPNPSFHRALDCRHRRVLLQVYSRYSGHSLVWDPITGDQQLVPDPDIDWLCYNAVVFCAVSGCDHLHCQRGLFRVLFIASDRRKQVKACVYSSETGAWSTPVTLGNDCEIYAQRTQAALDSYGRYYAPYFQPRRGAVIGDGIYFTVEEADIAIVKYDMRVNCLSVINLPLQNAHDIALMEMEDGSLGFVCIRGSSLYLWSRKVKSEGAAEWVQCKVVELGKRIPVVSFNNEAVVVGTAEGMDVIFVSTGAGLFTINVNSGQVKKMRGPGLYDSILPFMSFYTPGRPTMAKSLLARPRTR